MSKEQTHPLHATDKDIIDSLITKEEPEDLDFINLARLINRYSNFPGEIEIKNDLEITKSDEKPVCIWSIMFFTSIGITTPNTLTINRAKAPYKNSFLYGLKYLDITLNFKFFILFWQYD